MSVSSSISKQVSTSGGGSRVSHRHARAFSGGEPLAVELEAHLRFRENKERSSVVTSGVPSSRVRQILGAVLELAMLKGIEPRMLQVDVHRGDTGRYRHDYGLALAMAMVSSLVKKPIAPEILLLGDVDLCGNVRDVPARVIDRLNDAINAFEIETPLTVILATDSATWVNGSSTVQVLSVPTLTAAVAAVWPGQTLRAY